MRIVIAALVLLIGTAVAAPGAAAAEAQQPAQTEAVEEAPVEPYLEQPRDCGNRAAQRRGRRLVMSLACDQEGVAAEARTSNCAPRYAHRGHRRVHLRFRNCQPLFSTIASGPAHVQSGQINAT